MISHHLKMFVILHCCWRQTDALLIVVFYAINTGCPRRNVPEFGRGFLMLKYNDITQNNYVHS